MANLRLLQYFVWHASKTMALNSAKYIIWAKVVPDIARRNHFVMHLVLALAGLDLFCKAGERQYGLVGSDMPRGSWAVAANMPNKPAKEQNKPTQSDATTPESHDFGLHNLKAVSDHYHRGLQGFGEQYSKLSPKNTDAVCAGSALVAAFALTSIHLKQLKLGSGNGRHMPDVGWIHVLREAKCPKTRPYLRHVMACSSLRQLQFFGHANDDWEMSDPDELQVPTSLRGQLSRRLSAFVQGAPRAISDLKKHHLSLFLLSMASANGLQGGSGRFASSQRLSEQRSAAENLSMQNRYGFDAVKKIYMRILHLARLPPSQPLCPGHVNLQADFEDEAVMDWPEYLSPRFSRH